jgi:hypothetical protein
LTSNTNANFCTLNPLITGYTSSWGNLRNTTSNVAGTIQVTSGKWYYEATPTTSTIGDSNTYYTGVAGQNFLVYALSGNRFNGAAWVAFGASYATGDVIGVAFDVDAGTAAFYKNNVLQGTQSGTAGLNYAFGNISTANTNSVFDYNFGQRPFSYTPPTGFKSLNTFNLPTPTIPNGAAQFAATLYTGNGTSQSITNTVNGVSFQPDWVWVKGRSGATDHAIYDSVRGTTKQLESNTTTAETTEATGLTAFGTAGFTVGALAQMNTNAATYVGWQWKANGTPAVTNTSGSIPSTISANTTSGFSIVTYTGTGANATVGHGLGIAPSMVIVKNRTAGGAGYWLTWHKNMASASYYLAMNLTIAQTLDATVWNSTAPTSSVFSLGTNTTGNNSGTNFLAYCFSEIAGFSKFGSYIGNNSTDGPFVYCGFRPAFILVKRIDTTGNWSLWDNKRGNPFNVVSGRLYPDSSASEDTSTYVDLLANGFKLRTSGDPISNASGGTYIYAAFAESPFNYSLAR